MGSTLLRMALTSTRRESNLTYITDASGQRLYTTIQAAKYLDVHPGHIRKLIHRKELKPIKKGRDNLFTEESLDRYNESRRPRGRQVEPTKSKTVAEKRREVREYMRDYRKRKKGTTKKTAKKSKSKLKLAGS